MVDRGIQKQPIKKSIAQKQPSKIQPGQKKIINRNQPQEEEKKEEEKPKTGLYTNIPSQKFKIKTSDPFASKKKCKTNFGYVYQAGGIPCRIQHGNVNMKLQWDQQISDLPYDPLLVTCFEGLQETDHPYMFVARESVRQLLTEDSDGQKTVPLLNKLIQPIRTALMSKEKKVIEAVIIALKLLVETVGPQISQHLHLLLQQINKHAGDKQFKDQVYEILRIIEEQCGPEILPLIKQKIPTYSSVFK